MSETPIGRNLVLKGGALTQARDPETGRYVESGRYPAEGWATFGGVTHSEAIAYILARLSKPVHWKQFSSMGQRWTVREATAEDLAYQQRELFPPLQVVTIGGEAWVVVERRALREGERH